MKQKESIILEIDLRIRLPFNAKVKHAITYIGIQLGMKLNFLFDVVPW